MILGVLLSCVLGSSQALALPSQPNAPQAQTAVAARSEVSTPAVHAARWAASTAVKLWGALSAAMLGLSAVMAGGTVAMLASAAGLHVGYTGPNVGTDVLLGLAALSALGAGITLAIGLGAAVVGGMWWLADLLTDW